jgi:hypothetical protein
VATASLSNGLAKQIEQGRICSFAARWTCWAAAIPLTATTSTCNLQLHTHTTHNTPKHTRNRADRPDWAKEAQTLLRCGPPLPKLGSSFLSRKHDGVSSLCTHDQHGHAALPACPAQRAHSSRLKLTEVDFPGASTTRVPCGLGESNCVLPTRSVLSAPRLLRSSLAYTSELQPRTTPAPHDVVLGSSDQVHLLRPTRTRPIVALTGQRTLPPRSSTASCSISCRLLQIDPGANDVKTRIGLSDPAGTGTQGGLAQTWAWAAWPALPLTGNTGTRPRATAGARCAASRTTPATQWACALSRHACLKRVRSGSAEEQLLVLRRRAPRDV